MSMRDSGYELYGMRLNYIFPEDDEVFKTKLLDFLKGSEYEHHFDEYEDFCCGNDTLVRDMNDWIISEFEISNGICEIIADVLNKRHDVSCIEGFNFDNNEECFIGVVPVYPFNVDKTVLENYPTSDELDKIFSEVNYAFTDRKPYIEYTSAVYSG